MKTGNNKGTIKWLLLQKGAYTMNDFTLKSVENLGLPGYKTNSPVTRQNTIINCCLDWFKFVFPYSKEDKYLFDTSYNKIYEDYKENFPDMSDEEIFENIEKAYPGLQPGLHYIKNDNDIFVVWHKF